LAGLIRSATQVHKLLVAQPLSEARAGRRRPTARWRHRTPRALSRNLQASGLAGVRV